MRTIHAVLSEASKPHWIYTPVGKRLTSQGKNLKTPCFWAVVSSVPFFFFFLRQYFNSKCCLFIFMLRPSFCRSESLKSVEKETPRSIFPAPCMQRFHPRSLHGDPVWLVSLRPVWLDLGLSVLFVAGLLRQARGHSGSLHHCFEAALSLLDVLLRVEDDDIDLGYVEHAQGYGGAQAHGHGQGRGLDEHLEEICHISDGAPSQKAGFRFSILTQCSSYKFNLKAQLAAFLSR